MEDRDSRITDFERHLKQAIKEDLQRIKDPPPPLPFQRIMRNLEVDRGKRRLKLLAGKGLLSLCLIFLLSTSLYLFAPEMVTEGGRRFFNSVTYIVSGNFYIEAPESYPHYRDDVVRSLEELEGEAPFAIKKPLYVPPEFTATEVRVEDEGRGFNLALLFERGLQNFLIIQGDGTEAGDEGEKVEALDIAGYRGFLTNHEDGTHTLVFRDHRGIRFALHGNIERSQLLKVASSLY